MANNNTDRFNIELNDVEVWALIHMMRASLLREYVVEHCAMHDGWDTFLNNYQREYDLLEFFANLIGQPDMYSYFERELMKLLEEHTRERE